MICKFVGPVENMKQAMLNVLKSLLLAQNCWEDQNANTSFSKAFMIHIKSN